MIWEDRRLMVRVANLYYFEGFTQAQIAKKIGVSRPVISKLLNKAREEKVVEIYIKDENVHTVKLEQALEKKYELKEVVVVSQQDQLPEMVKRSIGRAAASYLTSQLTDVKRLGISWGTTLASLVNEFPYQKVENLNIVPLVGGMGRSNVEIHSNQLAYELAKKVNGTCSYLYAPAMVDSVELKDRLIENSDIHAVLEEGKQVEIALVGIGDPYRDSTMKKIGYLQETDMEDLKQAGAIGDIGSRFFNALGKQISHSLNERVIGMDLSVLQDIPLVIGVVEGKEKASSIDAAIRGRYVDVLITDDNTASALLDL
ncbi:sugar-binding transcriptional regulator [Radiobacillus kanasensis]|uniref:sugar-binding transcriptional regulator n=1 Tax=Radiobacillus kanasensis TaxID=2844358 RepID=UPI001E62947F|nr:sugar-binding transcriptional regulator [Radiobacillus kanasensis]UFT98605.1 sugar-binding transcriptional regulator [Radiobacillus kanasensis]